VPETLIKTSMGSFMFRDVAGGVARDIRVHYARPSSDIARASIVIAMHGLDRAAAAFRDVLVAGAERNKQIILVPEFDPEQFPGIFAYNFGGVRLPPPTSAVLPREQWSFGIVDRLFAYARSAVNSERTTFELFGNSAGAQFVLRYLALNEAPLVERAVAANCGIYMLPDTSIDYPTGMGGIDLDERDLRRFLTRRLIILIGEHDCDRDAHDLPRGEIAKAQGPHRLARGQWYVGHCTDLAARLGVALGWRHEIVPGARHVSQEIYDRASDILAE
jgi:hypothetical protein